MEKASSKKKSGRSFTALLIALWVLACPVASHAIGFDAETLYRSVFVIRAGNSLGSGFAIGPDCIVTNAHVVEGGGSIRVTTYDGEMYRAVVKLIDHELDIAALCVQNAEFPYLAIAKDNALNIGDDVYAIGAPNSLAYTLTKGILSPKDRKIGIHSYLQVDAAVNAGNNGGPLVNEEGEILGVVTMKLVDSEGIGLAIPISAVLSYLESNGVALTQQGNVQGPLASGAEPIMTGEAPVQTTGPAVAAPSGHAALWFAMLIVSVSVNILLAALLIRKRSRRKAKSDSDDFEIDIWE